MKEIIKIKNVNNYIYVYWVLTDFCNQHCSYCPPMLNLGEYASSDKFPSDDAIDKFIERLIEMSESTGKKLVILISGGEPTTHNKCKDIIERLRDHAIVMIHTNGTRGISWWRELSSLPHLVIISLHPEYYDSKKIRINELCEFLYSNGSSIQCNLMCLPDKWDVVMKIVEDIDDKFKPFIVPKILQHLGTTDRLLHSYTEEQLNFIKSYPTKLNTKFGWQCQTIYSDGTEERTAPNTIMAKGLHYFQNWKCSAGSEGISVYANGEVRAGICNIKSLGHISNFNLLDEYITCVKPSCVCPADIYLNKYNPAVVS